MRLKQGYALCGSCRKISIDQILVHMTVQLWGIDIEILRVEGKSAMKGVVKMNYVRLAFLCVGLLTVSFLRKFCPTDLINVTVKRCKFLKHVKPSTDVAYSLILN